MHLPSVKLSITTLFLFFLFNTVGHTQPQILIKYPELILFNGKVLTLEQAIHSMTGLPAAVFRVRDRGALRPGAFADVAVLDLAAVRDRATYEQPHQLAEGMRYVFVNGVAAIAADRLTGVRGGRLLVRVRP